MRSIRALMFPTNIGRLSYVGRVVVLLALHFGFSELVRVSLDAKPAVYVMIVWAAILLAYFYRFVVMPRLKNFGLPPLSVLLCFVPLLNVLIFCALVFGPAGHWQEIQRQRAES